MMRSVLSMSLGLSLLGLVSCTQSPAPESTTQAADGEAAETMVAAEPDSMATAEGQDLTQLFSRVWQSTDESAAPGSIYVFMANGTFLQTSCVETYAISGWTIDKATPNVLQVSENGEVAYTAEIVELTDVTLQLKQTLVRSGETRDVTLTAVEEEFVCPDLRPVS
ncbi:hypothetical protein ACQ4M4_21575 [Leptolyngbya sp. AN02str]|uniref:hypothetical protein n=1 Tax=Leptolyngbya sp. AN02str TaxID=3423363 RepID=UPI003D310D33